MSKTCVHQKLVFEINSISINIVLYIQEPDVKL